MKSFRKFLKEYWYEILLLIIFNLLIRFCPDSPSMIPNSFVWSLWISFLLWFAKHRKYKILLPLLMMLFLIIPMWIIYGRVPWFEVYQLLPLCYIIFCIVYLIQIWINNKFLKKKQKISKYTIFNIIFVLLISIMILYLSFIGIL